MLPPEHKYCANMQMRSHVCTQMHVELPRETGAPLMDREEGWGWRGGGGEPRVTDRSWHGVNSFSDGRHDSCVCECAHACLPGFIDHVPGAGVNAQRFQVLEGRRRPKSLHEKVLQAEDLRV